MSKTKPTRQLTGASTKINCLACSWRPFTHSALRSLQEQGAVPKDFSGYIPGVHQENIVLTQYVDGRQVGIVIYPIAQHEGIVENMNKVYDAAIAKIAEEVNRIAAEAMSGAVVDTGEEATVDSLDDETEEVEPKAEDDTAEMEEIDETVS